MEIVGYVIVGLVMFSAGWMACSHTSKLQQLADEDYQQCVRSIISQCSTAQALTYIDDLNRYMNDMTVTLVSLPTELEMIIRQVTGDWDLYE